MKPQAWRGSREPWLIYLATIAAFGIAGAVLLAWAFAAVASAFG